MAERDPSPFAGEKVLFETRPRFTLNLGSTILKIFILFLLLYLFTTVLALAVSVQAILIYYIQLPLVQATSYIMLLLVVILFFWIIWDLLSWRAVHYMLTTHRVMIKRGIFRKKKIYMPYNMIQDIDVSQGLLERLFKAGDIEIFGGHEHTQVVLEDIPNPNQVDNTINRLMQGEDIGYRKYKPKETKKSIIEEYDKKFKL
jgi:membrane protein YdbS with pleckstrin-like domain